MTQPLKHHYVLASLLTLALIATLLLWIARTRVADFTEAQTAIAQNAAAQLSKEIHQELGAKRRLAAVLRDSHAPLIARLAAAPDDYDAAAAVAAQIERYFPDSFAFTLADATGESFLTPLDGRLGELCLADLRRMATEGDYSIRIHPNPFGYHYDVMVPWPEDGSGGIFFVSFKTNGLARIIGSVENLGHRLILAYDDEPPLIELSSQGDRTALARDDYHLNPEERSRILATAQVPDTSWHVLDLIEPDVIPSFAAGIWQQAGLVFGGFALTSLILVAGSVQAERSRARAAAALEASRQDLEASVAERTRELRERNTRLHREIEARQDAERENARLAVFLREHPNPILLCDRQGAVIQWNRSAERTARRLGLAALDELLPDQALFSDTADAIEPISTLLAPLDDDVLEYSWYTDAQSGITFVYISDVTTRSRALERLAKSEAFLHQLTSVLAEGVMTMNSQAHVFFMNPEAEHLLGWTEADLAEHNVHERIHRHKGQGTPADECRIQKALRDGTVERVPDDLFFRRDGHPLPVSYTAAPMRDGEQITGVVVAFQDITERKALEERLRFAATHDALTGLYNRLALDQRLRRELERAQRYAHPIALLVADLDEFKSINDSHGHQAGDLVLRTFARCIKQSIRQSDAAGRFGGEEFVLILPESDMDAATQFAQRLCQQVASLEVDLAELADEPAATAPDISGSKAILRFTVSIGVACCPEHGQSEKALFAAADAALYRAKQSGRNRVCTASAPPCDDAVAGAGE